MLKTLDPACPTPPNGRWSMAQSEPRTARDRILVAASTLFCRHGFAATGIDTVIEQAGTAKATLYKHFSSKQELIEAALNAEGATWRSWFFGRLAEIQGAPDQRMLAVFDVLGEWFSDPGFYGCPFINAVAEFETGNDAVRKAAEAHKSHLMTWLKAQAIEMNLPDVQEVARSFAVLIDGAIVAAQHTRDASFAATARAMAEQLLAGARASSA
ncbi:TetR/AcrR family transcriptional regulator [Salipiger sp. P9]|uniref:TetR/AcrR family transcriptional regulator n=1 Tax=Salipiger pentaromativorans TaxID=2943193 RepID=UPI002157D8D5|nr:TetR/AcrR family transcriptional regulator [Salipiger pentaromativorans]MCR8550238.1 TetR/AcrR family transcriptional regulator [Salipiger pentaromativorans]